jgi:peptidyl-prolyl cis-trans isomerase C
MKLLREPLLHFLVIGALLFGIYPLVQQEDAEPLGRQIVVTRGNIERLAKTFRLLWQRPPTEAELNGLIETEIREEIFYRQAIALGLDKDDTIVRRRLAQKAEFLVQDALSVREPTIAELATYLSEHQEKYRVGSRLSFEQIFFDPGQRGGNAERDAREALARLPGDATGQLAIETGDPSLLPPNQREQSEDEIRAIFGREFTDAVLALAPGRWQGPLRSGYGWHLVRVAERREAQLPDLAEIETRVRQDWTDDQRRAADEDSFRRLRSRYDIVIEQDASAETGSAQAAKLKP